MDTENQSKDKKDPTIPNNLDSKISTSPEGAANDSLKSTVEKEEVVQNQEIGLEGAFKGMSILGLTLFMLIGVTASLYYLGFQGFIALAYIPLLFLALKWNHPFFKANQEWFESNQSALDFFQALLVSSLALIAFTIGYTEYYINYKPIGIKVIGNLTFTEMEKDTIIGDVNAYFYIDGIKKEFKSRKNGKFDEEINVLRRNVGNDVTIYYEKEPDFRLQRNKTKINTKTLTLDISTDLVSKKYDLAPASVK